MVGPWIWKQFGVNKHIENINFEGTYSGEKYNLVCISIDVLIFVEGGIGGFMDFIWYGVLNDNGIWDKPLNFSLD